MTTHRWIRDIVAVLLVGAVAVMPVAADKPKKPLKIDKIHARSSQSGVSLCVEMNEYLSDYETAQMKPYITLDPPTPFGVDVLYDEVCALHLKPRTTYTMRIDQRIPLGEDRLDKTYTFSKTTGDIDPSIRAKGMGYILPARGEITLPMETTNVSHVAVYLYRINTRNLIHSINRYNLLRKMSHWQLRKVAREEGEHLWRKRLTIESQPNQPKVTAIPIGSAMKKHEPGVYLLDVTQITDDGTEENYDEAMQWFMVSDIGLFSTEGSDELRVQARHLSDATVYPDVRFELIAADNEKLATATAKNGEAFFKSPLLKGKRGLKPRAVYAYGAHGDFSVLDLSRAPHDLSDRGVSGREALGRYNALVFSNRGIFRPGETVPFRALVRDAHAKPLAHLPLSAKLMDAEGKTVTTLRMSTDGDGYLSGTFPIASSAPTGRWQIGLYAGSAKPIGSLRFLVEDFVPPKIALKVIHTPQILLPDQEADIQASVHFLTGEALADAPVEVSAVLHAAKDPFPAYRKYHFGDMKESFGAHILKTETFDTDTNGTADITLTLKTTKHSSLPLAVHLNLSASEPGGRPVASYLDLFYEDKPAYLGLKPLFENDAVDQTQPPHFDLIRLHRGVAQPGTVRYRLIREEVEWNWRSRNDGDGWEYYRSYQDQEEVTTGSVALAAQPTPFQLAPLPWGSYRLELEDDRGDRTTYRFTSGYEESVSRASPDRLPVAVDRQNYRPGATVRVAITPKFSGPVTLAVANHRILTSRTLQGHAGKRLETTFTIQPDWGGSAWVMATAFRAQSAKLGADRAIGVAHLSIEDPARHIDVQLDAPKRIHSRETLTIQLHTRAAVGKPIRVIVAAVNEGVLNLTRYTPPDPIDFFFGKRRLGIAIRDLYGDIIKPTGAHAQFDVGAGDEVEENPLKEHVTASRRTVVALWSEAVTCDANGTATVHFDVPDFQGSLRLMAVAWSGEALGTAKNKVIVKDPVSAEIYLPRFLSAGDQAQSLLRVNIDPSLPEGSYDVTLESGGGVHITPTAWRIDHRHGGSGVTQYPVHLEATGLGEGTIRMRIRHAGIAETQRNWSIGIRAPYPESYVRQTGLLDAGKAIAYDAIADPTQWRALRHLTLRLSGMPLVAADSYRQELIDYTGRCAEQTTSRAFPDLEHPKAQQSPDTITLIQKAITRLSTLQRLSGGFGLWSSSDPNLWVSAYVMDFLTRAQEQGYAVSQRSITAGLGWLERHIDRWVKTDKAQAQNAYALYVLARTGRTLISPMRLLARSLMRSSEGWAHLAAAFAHIGEGAEAKRLFGKARKTLTNGSADRWLNYGGRLRDEAVLVTMLAEAKRRGDAIPLYADLARASRDRRWLSTQEMSTLLRASQAIGMEQTALKLRVNGQDLSPRTTWKTTADTLTDLPSVRNRGTRPVWYDLSFIGTPVPAFYQSASNHGFAIHKTIYTMEGTPVTLDQISHRSRLIVLLRGRIERPDIRHPLITDLVPAGFEIENPDISGSDVTESLKWLPPLSSTDHVAWRADRFEVAILPNDSNNTFAVAYAVRAVTRGRFTLPPVRIVDMYRPYYRAFGSVTEAKLIVRDPKTITAPTSAATDGNTTAPVPPSTLSEADYLRVVSRPVGELSRYSLTQLFYLRNAIFAKAGLDFSRTNPLLDRLFKPFKWYNRTTQNGGAVYARLIPIQRQNVQKLLAEEKRRCGGLVLADFYRVKTRALTQADLAKYDKQSLRILRNSLIARYGYRFHDPQLSAIFANMPWYHPTDISSSDVLDQKMTPLERANIQQILIAENGK